MEENIFLSVNYAIEYIYNKTDIKILRYKNI